MEPVKRRFSLAKKQAILKKAEQAGNASVLKEYNLTYNVLHRWRTVVRDIMTMPDLEEESGSLELSGRMKALLDENRLLKKILADQAIRLELKSEELRRIGLR